MKKVIALIVLSGLCGILQANIPGDVNSSGCVDMGDLSIFSAAWLSDNPACNIQANDGVVDGLDLAILAENWLLTAPGLIAGDIDGSGRVDMTDFSIFSAAWLSDNSPSANWNPACDLPDGIVDGLDLAILADHWLLTAPDANEMAFIPGGQFLMGDSLGDSLDPDPSLSNEIPVHIVRLDAFYIGKYEVTNGQYCDFLNSAFENSSIYVFNDVVYGSDNDERYCNTAAAATKPSLIAFDEGVFVVTMKDGRDMSEDPMIFVTWYGAAAYCNWRSEQDGYQACYNLSTWECDFTQKGYRLPTEAQWEYAARGGQYNPYGRFPWGDPNTISHDQANYKSNGSVDYDISPTAGYHPSYDDGTDPRTAPVGSFSPNGYGLYDMAGNAFEWCNDWYDKDYYDNSSPSNPTGPDSGDFRVIRGGSFSLGSDDCRVASRTSYPPSFPREDTGFRICLNLN